MILVNGGVPIAFANTEAPAAYGELISIGGLEPAVNGKLSSTIADILQTKLSIDSSRFYIKFYDVQVIERPLCCDVTMLIDLIISFTCFWSSAHSSDLMVRLSKGGRCYDGNLNMLHSLAADMNLQV